MSQPTSQPVSMSVLDRHADFCQSVSLSVLDRQTDLFRIRRRKDIRKMDSIDITGCLYNGPVNQPASQSASQSVCP